MEAIGGLQGEMPFAVLVATERQKGTLISSQETLMELISSSDGNSIISREHFTIPNYAIKGRVVNARYDRLGRGKHFFIFFFFGEKF